MTSLRRVHRTWDLRCSTPGYVRVYGLARATHPGSAVVFPPLVRESVGGARGPLGTSRARRYLACQMLGPC